MNAVSLIATFRMRAVPPFTAFRMDQENPPGRVAYCPNWLPCCLCQKYSTTLIGLSKVPGIIIGRSRPLEHHKHQAISKRSAVSLFATFRMDREILQLVSLIIPICGLDGEYIEEY
jgi:hypothetical protein